MDLQKVIIEDWEAWAPGLVTKKDWINSTYNKPIILSHNKIVTKQLIKMLMLIL